MVFYYWTNLNTVNFSIKSFVGTSNHVTTSVKFLLTKWKNPLLLHHLMWTHMWAMLNSEATGHILAMSSDSQTKFLWTLRRLGEVSNVRLWTYLINKERLAKGGSYPYQTSWVVETRRILSHPLQMQVEWRTYLPCENSLSLVQK